MTRLRSIAAIPIVLIAWIFSFTGYILARIGESLLTLSNLIGGRAG